MSQRKYALDILEETGMLDCKSVNTPMEMNAKLVLGQGASMRSKEISTTSGKTKLPHHHPTGHFLSCECS